MTLNPLILTLAFFVVVAIVIFLSAWRGFQAEIGAALTAAVIGTAILGVITYLLATMGRYA